MLRHPATGLFILTPFSFYAMYLGLSGRREKNGKKKRQHASLMHWVAGLTVLAAVDGHISLKTVDSSKLWSSTHAVSGACLLSSLVLQGIASQFIKDNDSSRHIHTVVGTGIGLLFLVHAGTGISLLLEI